MSLQTGEVAMVALGVDSDPSLTAGVHLRWSLQAALGFPPLGFDVFRRLHRPGSPRTLDFTAEPEGDVSTQFQRGPTTWSTAASATVPRFREEPTNEGSFSVLFPGLVGALTCRFALSELPIRRIEVDVVHTASPIDRVLPFDLEIWGLSGVERVARGITRLTDQNRSQVLQVQIFGDKLDGFQLRVLGLIATRYGIVRVRWVPVSDEAELGWGGPLNPLRIGLPVTAPGYFVRHAHSPDLGAGAEDWQEAADRLSPTGTAAGLPPPLALRYGPPIFAGTRTLMRQALTRQPLVAQPAAAKLHRVRLDPVEVALLAALDPDLARLLGLALVDRTAAAGTLYDYRVTGYWPGQLRLQLVCSDVSAGGTTIATGASVALPSDGGGTPVVMTAEAVAAVVKPAATLGHANAIVTGAWSRDGERLVTVSADGVAQLWNADGSRLARLDPGDVVLGAAWGDDRTRLLVTAWHGTGLDGRRRTRRPPRRPAYRGRCLGPRRRACFLVGRRYSTLVGWKRITARDARRAGGRRAGLGSRQCARFLVAGRVQPSLDPRWQSPCHARRT